MDLQRKRESEKARRAEREAGMKQTLDIARNVSRLGPGIGPVQTR